MGQILGCGLSGLWHVCSVGQILGCGMSGLWPVYVVARWVVACLGLWPVWAVVQVLGSCPFGLWARSWVVVCLGCGLLGRGLLGCVLCESRQDHKPPLSRLVVKTTAGGVVTFQVLVGAYGLPS